MENANFEFNRASGVNREQRMDQSGRDHQDALNNVSATDLQNHDADHQQHQAQRIADEEARLTKHHELNISAPRPTWAPVPTMPTADQIRADARKNVQTGHEQSRDDLEARHKIAAEDHERQAGGYPAVQGNYDARKAEYMAKIKQRRERERQQEHDHDREL
jgi:hypothetical protein